MFGERYFLDPFPYAPKKHGGDASFFISSQGFPLGTSKASSVFHAIGKHSGSLSEWYLEYLEGKRGGWIRA